ncbi:MAG TPA: hypothetical protein VH724_02855, partial [Candidatus Angelobacter sp.]|nr:hypothetical protein [Candidatus Angelobacter sp.]
MIEQLHSKNLVPFKKRGSPYSIPGMTAENELGMIDRLEHDLSLEEQRYIRHYVSYADTFLERVQDMEPLLQEDASYPTKERKLEESKLKRRNITATPVEIPVVETQIVEIPTQENQDADTQPPAKSGPDAAKRAKQA